MKKKGNAFKKPKRILKLPKKKLTKRFGLFSLKKLICSICPSKKHLTVHHIVHQSKGGSHERKNLMVLCEPCHVKIHHPSQYAPEKKLLVEYLKKQKLIKQELL